MIVVSPLAVMDFEEETGFMRIRSLNPGVTVEVVQADTGFELVVPDSIPETEPPTRDQVDLIRNVIDPQGRRRHRM